MSSSKISFTCPNCGGNTEFNGNAEFVKCPYCEEKYSVSDLLNESDDIRAERIKSNAFVEAEKNKIQLEREKLQHEAEKELKNEEQENAKKFRKSKVSKVLIVFMVIAGINCINCFSSGGLFIISGIITALMFVLFLLSYLMGIQVVKEKRKGARVIFMVIGCALYIPCMLFSQITPSYSVKYDEIKWSENQLSDILPEPKSDKGEINESSKDILRVDIGKTDKDDYNDYESACKKKGFTQDSEKDSFGYKAYNSEGYQLELSYNETLREMSITLNAPGHTDRDNSDDT